MEYTPPGLGGQSEGEVQETLAETQLDLSLGEQSEAQKETQPIAETTEAQETQPIAETTEAQETQPIAETTEEAQTICDHTNYMEYIYRDPIDDDESEPIKCDLRWQIFPYTDFQYANFSYADFSFSDVLYVDMRQTNLRYANLHHTIFQYVNFSFADLRGAIFSQTVFFMSDFTGTLVTSEQADYLIERGISGFVVMEL